MNFLLRLTFVFLSIGFSNYSMASERDGTWWLSNSQNSQLVYVQGFLEGVLNGISVSMIYCYVENGRFIESAEAARCAQDASNNYAVGYNRYYPNVSALGLSAQLTSFYQNKDNINISFRDAVTYLLLVANNEPRALRFLENSRSSSSPEYKDLLHEIIMRR